MIINLRSEHQYKSNIIKHDAEGIRSGKQITIKAKAQQQLLVDYLLSKFHQDRAVERTVQR